jgi:hypothetical protein
MGFIKLFTKILAISKFKPSLAFNGFLSLSLFFVVGVAHSKSLISNANKAKLQTKTLSKQTAQIDSVNPKFSLIQMLSFHAVKRLSPKARVSYIKSLTKTLILLETNKPKEKVSFNTLDFLLSFIQNAHANIRYTCIGGGVPVPSANTECGVQSYAGFSCPAGLEICNPIIFGVDRNNQPVCHQTAHTRWCFENTKLGVDHFLEPVFELNNQAQWEELKAHLEEACNEPSLIAEEQEKVIRACEFVRRQMVHNQEVKNLMNEIYTYKNEDGYLTQSATLSGVADSAPAAADEEPIELIDADPNAITMTVLPPLEAEASSGETVE